MIAVHSPAVTESYDETDHAAKIHCCLGRFGASEELRSGFEDWGMLGFVEIRLEIMFLLCDD